MLLPYWYARKSLQYPWPEFKSPFGVNSRSCAMSSAHIEPQLEAGIRAEGQCEMVKLFSFYFYFFACAVGGAWLQGWRKGAPGARSSLLAALMMFLRWSFSLLLVCFHNVRLHCSYCTTRKCLHCVHSCSGEGAHYVCHQWAKQMFVFEITPLKKNSEKKHVCEI